MAKRTCAVEEGQQFGRLVVIDPEARFPSKNPRHPSGRRAPVVECGCGTVKQVAIYDLLNGAVVSCGCHRTAVAASRFAKRNAENGWDRNGASKHREFGTWQHMIYRCHNEAAANWHRYGGRGIQVCRAWRNDTWAFLNYLDEHLGPRPEGMSLDRVDNNGNYEPGNIRWATVKQQQNNRECSRSSRSIT